MSLAESQRILTNPFQDDKALPPEPPKPLCPAGLTMAGDCLG